MYLPKHQNSVAFLLLLTMTCTQNVRCEEERKTTNRNYSTDDLDESSCVCGLSKEVLDRLESIVQLAGNQQCSNSHHAEKPKPEVVSPAKGDDSRDEHGSSSSSSHTTSRPDAQELSIVVSNQSNGKHPNLRPDQVTSDSSNITTANLINEILSLQAQLASLRPDSGANQQPEVGANSKPSLVTSSQGVQVDSASSSSSNWIEPGKVVSSQSVTSNSNGVSSQTPELQIQQEQVQKRPESSGFLEGLPASSVNSAQTNTQIQQDQPIETQQVQQAVVTTVPNVVSNIFTNIQDFAIQTEKNPNNAPGSTPAVTQLTSIDGSSTQLNKNDTAAQITAQGEQLFLQWIEHQIQAYHMTASMAGYIRKSALNLFRRIVKQYVQRIERLGGAVESNVRQATQLALHNTQTLISFLMRNYLNFAGGLMQIIGEQVSRVGKQLDSTGGTIAHINLNPFDIVSNVIDSLPNPARYSEYFRAFGKYLMGESSSSVSSPNGNDNQSGAQQETEADNNRRKGLFSKTMGALSKTFGSWIG